MLTIREVARLEADRALVVRTDWDNWTQERTAQTLSITAGKQGWENSISLGGISNVQGEATHPDLEKERRRAAAVLTDVIERAIERALAQCPVPGGLTDEQLSYNLDITREVCRIVDDSADHREFVSRELFRIVVDRLESLASHVEHLHRIMHTPESQAIAEAYDRGIKEGLDKGFDEGYDQGWDESKAFHEDDAYNRGFNDGAEEA